MSSITDSVGNGLSYVVDNTGNRLSEITKDASGSLAKTITRAFDALNRVQSATWAIQ